MTQGIRIRHLTFTGPQKRVATLEFGPGMNVLYGASDTGKSFVVNAIDFMLGGKGPLPDIPEREGYDRVLLGIENLGGESFTIHRSASGGAFTLFNGLFQEFPDVPGCELREQHNDTKDDNLSSFLLEQVGLKGKRLRKNARGETVSLSFRNLARLAIVDEEEIIQKRSPLSDGNKVVDTPNQSTFKLLLTGIDDSALSGRGDDPANQSRGAQIDLLNDLIADYQTQIKGLSGPAKELEEQSEKLETTIERHAEQLNATESAFREATADRRALRKKWDAANERLAEIEILEERFSLLNQHYQSDLERLRGIEEAGTLFSSLETATCPLCGADPSHQELHTDCDGNTELVVSAARAEIAKIEQLQRELGETVAQLSVERRLLEIRIPRMREKLDTIASYVETQITPNLRSMRSTYAELSNKKAEVRESLGLYRSLQNLEERKAALEREVQKVVGSSTIEDDLPTAAADRFSMQVLDLLKEWHFPNIERVHFERSIRDLVINGKNRTSFGKGLRAITQSAFTIGLLEYCRNKNTPHPGFVILDSPLLSYRPEINDDGDESLKGTDVKSQFYEYLANTPEDRQVIIIENTDPPEAIQALTQAIEFTRTPRVGRPGFFPIEHENASPSLG
ncbi:MAG: AAA family ATPase [Methylocystis silviterrae]|uniref:AAA family ATPase n=1 Tax=Methylocystis silviterrae TaxID=2743612 RepID=UPI003C75F7C0